MEQNPSPGQYDHKLHPGKSFQIGTKKSVNLDNGVPGIGKYDASEKHTRHRVQSAIIQPESPLKNVTGTAQHDNGPGQYDYNHGKFGHDMKNVTIGGKYVT
jgi:hypothetical protein